MRPMKSKFHTSRHGVPSLNVASMPDLIFTVLFFFMIVTHMRSDEVKVRLEVPQGTEVQKLANKASVINIYIGRQDDNTWGVQLNGDLVMPEEIRGGDLSLTVLPIRVAGTCCAPCRAILKEA